MRFVVDKVALGQDILRVLLLSPVGIIPPLLYTHLHLDTTVILRTSGGSFKGRVLFGILGIIGR
jgi:hypothetical protein